MHSEDGKTKRYSSACRRHRLLQRLILASPLASPHPLDEARRLPPFSVCARPSPRGGRTASSSVSSEKVHGARASPSSATFAAREEQRRQALKAFISRLDELFNLPHQQWLPSRSGLPLGAKRARRQARRASERAAAASLREQGSEEDSTERALPSGASAHIYRANAAAEKAAERASASRRSPRDDALSAQEALLAACRLAATRGDFQWCLQGLNLLVNFGRLRPDWEVSERLMALALHCRRLDQAEELLTAFPHFLASPPSPVLLFALMDEALAAGRPQDVRRIISTMREQWQVPIRPSFYVAAIRAMLLLPISPDQSLKEAHLIAEDAAALGVPLPPVAHQLLVERALSLVEERLLHRDSWEGGRSAATHTDETKDDKDEGDDKEGDNKDEGDKGSSMRVGSCYSTEELLTLAGQLHIRAFVDQARDAGRRGLPSSCSRFFSPPFSPRSPAVGPVAAELSRHCLWSLSPSAALLVQSAWLQWALERHAERKQATATSLTTGGERNGDSRRTDHAGESRSSSWLHMIRQACATSLEELGGSAANCGSVHRTLPPAFLAALIRSREMPPSGVLDGDGGGHERESELRRRRTLLRERREASEALHALQHSAFSGRLSPVAVLSAFRREAASEPRAS
ncbi:conserved hypothetical protein [Neospora caninum Liverpool]|uniref:Uncharacterized protein n=1 Tax=Neospora caninum (strain Liverpool) TaxID=572307 RepID=F0VC63_NEOCL|nr:conserved hypothetical protein [Neospora caninum Liverpool]CBZ51197.1 conserved hypothetical protein [Neospora caninum Liverpool]|eukprot:XP_003881230.1 conserved hypothetical protein [Neospora caninum Liverpool]